MEKNENGKKHPFIYILFLVILIIAGVLLYARFVATTGLRVNEYIIESDRLPANFDGLKIVHFSDLHYGSTIFLPEVERMVNKINSLRPDIIIFTGDLIDDYLTISETALDNLIRALSELNATTASFAVRGNHDQDFRFDRFIEETDFQLLNNEHQLFYFNGTTPIVIVGLDDPYSGDQDISLAFYEIPEDYYTILLAHQPDVIMSINYHVDLFLAGHSHGGQVRLPFIGAPIRNHGARIFRNSEYIYNNTQIFISSGLGTSQYHFRLFNRPSINFYRFLAQ